jgi:hypothetical protein
MRVIGHLMYAAIILACFAKCNNRTANQDVQNNPDSIKKIILGINDQMINAAGDSINGAKIYMSFCTDSIIASYDGDFSRSPFQVSHDLGNGVTEGPHNFTFLLFDKTAILSFLETAYELINTDTLYHHLRVTKVFVLDQGKWKMATVFDALQPVNYFQPIKDKNSNLYKSFAGVYQLTRNDADTLFVKDGKLFSIGQGGDPQLNFPVDDSEYMEKDDFGRVVFNKDSKGKVNSYTYLKYDGQKIHARKIK